MAITTNAELIEALQVFDPEAPVQIQAGCDLEEGDLPRVIDVSFSHRLGGVVIEVSMD